MMRRPPRSPLFPYMTLFAIESKSRAFTADLLHEAFRLTSERKASCWRAGQELVVAGGGLQQDLRVAAVDRGPDEEVRTDHFQAAPPRLVRPKPTWGLATDVPAIPTAAIRIAERSEE